MAGQQIESTREHDESNKKLLIQLSCTEWNRANAGELRRAVQYFGGVETKSGFKFPSAVRRAEALDILADKYGTRSFQAEDRQDHDDGLPRLLVADSDATLSDIYESYFSQEGYEVDVVANGVQCLALIRQRVPDVLVLEYELPWGGGDGVLAILRREFPFTPLGVVLITCDYSREDISHELVPPVIGCLRKPFRLCELLETTRSVTQLRTQAECL